MRSVSMGKVNRAKSSQGRLQMQNRPQRLFDLQWLMNKWLTQLHNAPATQITTSVLTK